MTKLNFFECDACKQKLEGDPKIIASYSLPNENENETSLRTVIDTIFEGGYELCSYELCDTCANKILDILGHNDYAARKKLIMGTITVKGKP